MADEVAGVPAGGQRTCPRYVFAVVAEAWGEHPPGVAVEAGDLDQHPQEARTPSGRASGPGVVGNNPPRPEGAGVLRPQPSQRTDMLIWSARVAAPSSLEQPHQVRVSAPGCGR